ncbi:MAG: hypothetical protein K940chlam7_01691 [Chlamydiae bacterium]|nr:hypothetical protein [Chlamydiota bacterium]
MEASGFPLPEQFNNHPLPGVAPDDNLGTIVAVMKILEAQFSAAMKAITDRNQAPDLRTRRVVHDKQENARDFSIEDDVISHLMDPQKERPVAWFEQKPYLEEGKELHIVMPSYEKEHGFLDFEKLQKGSESIEKWSSHEKSPFCKIRDQRKDRYPRELFYPFAENAFTMPTVPYINASVMLNGLSILTQGPTLDTLEDFWEMVWHSEADTIVMATNLTEPNIIEYHPLDKYVFEVRHLHRGYKEKCFQYWPPKPNEKFIITKDLTVINEMEGVDQPPLEGAPPSLRTLKLKLERKKAGGMTETRSINHLHIQNWPDHDAIPDLEVIYRTCEELERMHDSAKGPFIAHCSAGVGRSGAFVACYTLFKLYRLALEKKKCIGVDIADLVWQMRSPPHGRNRAIMKFEQYRMLYSFLLLLQKKAKYQNSAAEFDFSSDSEGESHELPPEEKERFMEHLRSDRAKPGEYGYWKTEGDRYEFCQKLDTGVTEVEKIKPRTVASLDSLREALQSLPSAQQELVSVILHQDKGEIFIKGVDLPPGAMVLCTRPQTDGTVKVNCFLKGLNRDVVKHPNVDLEVILKDPKKSLLDLQIDYLRKHGHWVQSKEEVRKRIESGRVESDQFFVWESQRKDGSFGFYQKTGKSSELEKKDLLRINPDQSLITTIASYDINNIFGRGFSPYSKQLILNLGSGRSAQGMARKAEKQRLESRIIELRGKDLTTVDSDPNFIDTRSPVRVYITGHSRSGADDISSDDFSFIDEKVVGKTKWTAGQFAEFLSRSCSKLETTEKNPIVVSLMSCEAALSNDGRPSFAERLSQALANRGLHATVKARTDNVLRTSESRIENFHKWVSVGNNFCHHAEGTKLEFYTMPHSTKTIITQATYKPRGNLYTLVRFDPVLTPFPDPV